jgi:hypothetical protein
VQSRVVRLLLLLAPLAAGLAACGGSTPTHQAKYGIFVENLPKHRVLQLNWTESARDLKGNDLMTFQVKTLEVGPNGWKAKVSFRNASTKTILLPKGGPRSPQSWGLGVFTSATSQRVEDQGNYEIKTKAIEPALPADLKPGQSWSGVFSAPEPPRARRWLHLVFGVFFWKGKPPAGLGPYFLWITTHPLRAPPPQGIAATVSTSS